MFLKLLKLAGLDINAKIAELKADLDTLHESLTANNLGGLARGRLRALRRAADVFGFHLASLDIRQNSDAALRGKELSDLQNLILNDYPAIFLYSPYYGYFTRKDLHGVNPGLIDEPADRFQNVSAWYLKTARVLK